MSSSSLEDLSESLKAAQRTTQGMIKVAPDQMTPGRQKLRSWLGKYFRVVITDGRILVGVLSCTDKDANIVLAGCVEYITEDGEPRILGNVMVPGKHIRSVEVEQRPSDEATVPPPPQSEVNPEDAPKEIEIIAPKQSDADKPEESEQELSQAASETAKQVPSEAKQPENTSEEQSSTVGE